MTITQQAEKFTHDLNTARNLLEQLVNCDYYRKLADTGFYLVEVTLTDALRSIRETQEINDWVRACLASHPYDSLKDAIAKTLESQNPCA